MFILRAAEAAEGAAVAGGGAAAALAVEQEGDGPCRRGQDHPQDYPAGQVHPTSRAIWYAPNATTQATMHWNTTTNAAHLPPSSRLTAATAATHGV